MVDFDSLVDDSQAKAPDSQESFIDKIVPHAPSTKAPIAPEHQDFDSLVSDEDKHGTAGQQAIAGLEGVAKGALGPLATAIETGGKDVTGPFKPLMQHFPGLGVKAEDIRGRAEANPWTHGIGEAAGFVGSALAGTGEAALMSEVGGVASKALGLGESTLLARVGSEAAKQATEMAILASGDEVSKRLVNDPNTSAESAIANIGLSAAIGGGAGAFMTGAISPLWKATVGPKVEQFLTHLKTQTNGGSVLPEQLQQATKTLGVEPDAILSAAMSGNKTALEAARNLFRGENAKFTESLRGLQDKAARSVADKLGVPLEDALSFSNKEQGVELAEMAKKTITDKYGPRAIEQQAKQAERLHMNVPEDDVIQLASTMHQMGSDELISSDYRKMFEKTATDILEKKTVGGLDSLRSELGSKLRRAEGTERMHLGRMMETIDQFADDQVEKQAIKVAGKGTKLGDQAIMDATVARNNYKQFAKEMDGLSNYLGVGDFRGTGTLLSKLDNLTAETLVKKFATKGDVEGAKFLNETFPDLAEKVRQHEAKQFLSKSIKEVSGEPRLDTGNLSKRISDLRKGQPEYVDYVLPKQGIEAIEAAQHLSDGLKQITDMKNSGTPAGLAKLFGKMGSGVMGVASYLSGHGLIGTGVATALGQVLQAAPDHVRLALLKYLGSGAPIKAEGFKAMVDYIGHTAKAEKYMNSAIEGVFKVGSKANVYIPSGADLAKLDKLVAKNEKNPEATAAMLANGQTGHYLPEHQAVLAKTSVTALNYLQSLKPKPQILGPLDRPIEPSPAQQARYERALTIAENPNVIMNHIKEGTLQINDIKDLGSMYPAVYQQMVTKITNQIATAKDADEPIPYKVRLGLSLFMAQPMDGSMTPSAIMAAQPVPKQPPQQGKAASGSTNKLGKSNNSYKTPSQEAEHDRSARD